MENIVLSIIIPHYNSPNLLIRLINSIPKRKDIQILVIDDNSTCDIDNFIQFIKNEPNYNIELYHNTTGTKGAGSCRNIGLEKALGQWLIFADADDFFTEDFYKEIEPYLHSDYDEIFFTPTSLDEKTGQIASRHISYCEMVENYIDHPSLKTLTEMKYGFCTPWSKMIKASIIKDNQIQFDQVMVSNDIMCMTKCAFHSKKIAAVKGTIYCVTRGERSLTTTKSSKNFDIRVQVLINRYSFLRENLSTREFRYTHVDRVALARLVDIFMEKFGLSKFFSVLTLYRQNKISFFDIGLLNPFVFFHKVTIMLKWWGGINNSRKI